MEKRSRRINLIVIHCSASREDRDYPEAQLEEDHRRRGFDGIGYHFYVRKDGRIVTCRPLSKAGAHARGYNAHSAGICYEGGLDNTGKPKDTRTLQQKHSMRALVRVLLSDYPGSRVCGHRDLSPDRNGNGEIEPEEWVKQCPCFCVGEEVVHS